MMMYRILILIVFVWSVPVSVGAQSADFDDARRNQKGARIVFYNVENLFDTADDPEKMDEDFTPYGLYKWDSVKYKTKLNNIAKVIIATGGWEPPTLVGLAEVENDSCLQNLINHTALSLHSYDAIHFESPDRRGIDVALLYRTDKFTPLKSMAVQPPPHLVTRDNLYVTGIINSRDTIHLYVNHWPSRYGGQIVTEQKRMSMAEVLLQHTDSVIQADQKAKIIIMGDFNDQPGDRSIQLITGQPAFSNAMECHEETGNGTYALGQNDVHWEIIDQFIISKGFTSKTGCGFIFKEDWMTDKYGRPKRALRGDFFTGGFSDHLPIVIDFVSETPALKP